jgi:hypothetical protein
MRNGRVLPSTLYKRAFSLLFSNRILFIHRFWTGAAGSFLSVASGSQTFDRESVNKLLLPGRLDLNRVRKSDCQRLQPQLIVCF